MVLQSFSIAGGSLPVWKKEELLRTDVSFDMIFRELG